MAYRLDTRAERTERTGHLGAPSTPDPRSHR